MGGEAFTETSMMMTSDALALAKEGLESVFTLAPLEKGQPLTLVCPRCRAQIPVGAIRADLSHAVDRCEVGRALAAIREAT